jgi:hypothetical protein
MSGSINGDTPSGETEAGGAVESTEAPVESEQANTFKTTSLSSNSALRKAMMTAPADDFER